MSDSVQDFLLGVGAPPLFLAGIMALAAFSERERRIGIVMALIAAIGLTMIIIGATATITSRTSRGSVEHAPDLRCIAMERVPYDDEWLCTKTVQREP